MGEEEGLLSSVCFYTLSVPVGLQKVVYSVTDGESLLVGVMLVHSAHCSHAVSTQEQKQVMD